MRHVSRLVVVGVLLASAAGAGLVPGGGNVRSDCYAELDVTPLAGATVEQGRIVTCRDGDACDLGPCGDRRCDVRVALCLRQADPALPECRAPASLDAVRVKSGKAVPIDVEVPTDFGSSVCAAFVDVAIPLKMNRKGEPRGPRNATLKVTAKAPKGTKPRGDVDRYALRCVPRDVTCPGGTTTTTASASTTSSSTTNTSMTTTTTLSSSIAIVSRNSNVYAQVAVATDCTPNGDQDQKQSTTLDPWGDAVSVTLTCMSPNGLGGTLSDMQSASASQSSSVSLSSGVLVITGTFSASTSATMSCDPPHPSCPNLGVSGNGSGSGIGVEFDVVGTQQPYQAAGGTGNCGAQVQDRTTFAITYLTDGQNGLLQPAQYRYVASCGAGRPTSGSPENHSSTFTFTVGD